MSLLNMHTLADKRPIARWKHIIPYLMILLFSLPYGIVVNQILVPHAIVGGGLTGICEILFFATDGAIPIWISQLSINLLFLLGAAFTVGWRFCLKTIYCVACLTFWLRVLPVAQVSPIADPFIAMIVAAIINGIGMGVIFLNDGSTGGMDIVAIIINAFRSWQLGRILMAFDLFIICSAYFLPEVHSIRKILYVLAFDFVATNIIDFITLWRPSPSKL